MENGQQENTAKDREANDHVKKAPIRLRLFWKPVFHPGRNHPAKNKIQRKKKGADNRSRQKNIPACKIAAAKNNAVERKGHR